MKIETFSKACEALFQLDALTLSDSYYYDSLPLCVIDAVFSIGVRYTCVQNTVRNYCQYFHLRSFNLHGDTLGDKHTISDLIARIEALGVTESADTLFQNHQRTSSHSGILKSEAVLRFAKVLQQDGVLTLSDYQEKGLSKAAEREILSIPGQKSGLSLHYFYMLAGSDDFCKPDRHVLRFIEQHTTEKLTATEAQRLLSETVARLKPSHLTLTVRLLDYTIWNSMAHRGQDAK